MSLAYPTLAQADLRGKRVLLRAGFDVPMEDGKVIDTSRVEALVPTMRLLLDSGARLVLLAHQGRPKGKPDPVFSQKPLVPVLQKLLGVPVHFAPSCVGPEAQTMASALKPGEVLLLENLRYDPREEKNDSAFAKELAALGDAYVNDAFTNCHRAHASMVGIPALLPSYMGLQLEQEVRHLSRVIQDPRRPLTLLVGGAKMETKVPVVEHFLGLGDDILLGGAVSNTFVAAKGFDVGASLYEQDYVATAREILAKGGAKVHVPTDALCAEEIHESARPASYPVKKIPKSMRMLDIGEATLEHYVSVILRSGSIVWNGPVGYFESEPFSHASKRIAEAIKQATRQGAVSVIGGGDTIDLHTRYGLDLSGYSFVSTGGGAMLEFVSGKPLPALEALARSAS